MRKIYPFLTIVFIVFSVTTLAQSVKIVEVSNPTVDVSGTEMEIVGSSSDIVIYGSFKVINQSGSAIDMAFKRKRVVDSGELDQICDNQGCFNAADTYEWQTSPVTINNNDTSDFKPQIMPNGNDFCGLHVYYVVDDQDVVYDSITLKIRTSKENCFLNIANHSLKKSTFKFYPNPARNILTIENLSSGMSNVILLDALGKKVLSSAVSGSSTKIDISSLKNGVYFVELLNEAGVRSETKKLIIQN